MDLNPDNRMTAIQARKLDAELATVQYARGIAKLSDSTYVYARTSACKRLHGNKEAGFENLDDPCSPQRNCAHSRTKN